MHVHSFILWRICTFFELPWFGTVYVKVRVMRSLVHLCEELCESFFSSVKTMEIGIHREQSEAVIKYVKRSRGDST